MMTNKAETSPVPDTGRNQVSAVVYDLPTVPPVPATPPEVARWGRIGLLMILAGVGGFLLWGATLELATGAHAIGMVRLSDDKQVVAHIEGGIIRAITVKEGDVVHSGQDLAVLDDYASETNLAILEKRRWEMMARKARLEAVRDRLDAIIFPTELTDAAEQQGNMEIADILSAQRRQFTADRTELDGQKQILDQQIAQINAMITSLREQITAGQDQLDLIAEEVKDVETLLARGLERRPRLLALQRNQAALNAQQSDFNGRIASYEEKIGESRLQMINLDSDTRAKAISELTQTQTELTQVDEQWLNARTRSREMTLRASMDGRVINLRRSSVGSVIAPGMTLMEIVPDNKIYVVDANVSPMDIDVVQKLPVGPLPEDQPAAAQIRLTGLKQRTHVTLRAIIQRVSPDAIIDDKSGVSYFSARVSFDAGDPNFKRLLDNGELYAGMPAEVSFIASHRTMLQYLVQPLIDSFYRSFHEE